MRRSYLYDAQQGSKVTFFLSAMCRIRMDCHCEAWKAVAIFGVRMVGDCRPDRKASGLRLLRNDIYRFDLYRLLFLLTLIELMNLLAHID